jgi:RNase P/RNase MRP subunit p29
MNKHRREYIGKPLTVTHSTNTTLAGVHGTVIDETKNTFRVATPTKTITLLKHPSTFRINGETVNGRAITKQPHNRIKIKTS